MSKDLLLIGGRTLHSGGRSNFKIECDALIGASIATAAHLIAKTNRFKSVHGVPEGGIPLAMALERYVEPDSDWPHLIVDDVLTTGDSIVKARNEYLAEHPDDEVMGYVLFRRANPSQSWWVGAMFTLNQDMWYL